MSENRRSDRYTIEGFDPDEVSEPRPASVEQYWSRPVRSWVTVLLDENGGDLDIAYDGTRADAACSMAAFKRRVEK